MPAQLIYPKEISTMIQDIPFAGGLDDPTDWAYFFFGIGYV